MLSLLAGCGAGPERLPQDAEALSEPVLLDAAIEQISALTAPDPESEAVLRQLQQALIAQLQSASVDGRHVSTPPLSERDSPQIYYGSGALRWAFANTGDYDQNSQVNAADLIPLSRHFGERAPFESNSEQQLVDGDGNGEINLADVAPIAQHFGVTNLWNVYSASDPAAYGGLLGEDDRLLSRRLGKVYVHEGIGSNQLLQYSMPLQRQLGEYYWVRCGDSREFGIASSLLPALGNTAGEPVWAGISGGPRHNGRSRFAGPRSPDVLWKQDLGSGGGRSPSDSSPVIDAAGNIYAIGISDQLQAFSPAGELLWKAQKANYRSSPALSADGLILYGGNDFRLHALDAEGSEIWSLETGGELVGSPLVASDGRIYVGSSDFNLYCVDPQGELLWNSANVTVSSHAPAEDGDGSIIVSGADFQVHAFRPDGEYLWHVNVLYTPSASPVLAADGTIYVGTIFGFHALNSSGIIWSLQAEASVPAAPALAPDGTIYLPVDNIGLLALDPDGGLLWAFSQYSVNFSHAPLVDALGNIYLIDNYTFRAFRPDGSQFWEMVEQPEYAERPTMSMALGSNGTLHALGGSRYLYAIGDPGFVSNLCASDGEFLDHIHISWEPLLGADAYQLQYRLPEASRPEWKNLAKVEGNSANAFEHLADPEKGIPSHYGLLYEYRVGALREGGSVTSWSAADSGFRTLTDVHSLIATDDNSGEITVAWQAVPGADGYTLEYRNTDGGFPGAWTELVSLSGDSPAHFRHGPGWPVGLGCEYGLHYQYRVRARYQAELSLNWSNVDSGIRREGWSTERHDQQHSGRSLASGPVSGMLAWKQPLGASVVSPLVRDGGDVLTVNGDYKLLCLDSAGSELWQTASGQGGTRQPQLRADGTVLTFGFSFLRPVDADGELQEKQLLDGNFGFLLQLPSGGLVYADDHELVCHEPGGSELWRLELPVLLTGLSCSVDGNIHAAGRDGYMFSISADGHIRWTYRAAEHIAAAPAIAADGSIYFADEAGMVHALYADGSLRWQYDCGAEVSAGVVLGSDGSVHLGCLDGSFHSINADGSPRWQFSTAGPVRQAAALDGKGNLYFGSDDYTVYALDSSGNLLWSYRSGAEIRCPPAISEDGTLYIGSLDGNFLAFRDPE
ncbi:MAG: PQQ-binding-like beta-propeller repeat protein [bacterium]